MNRLKRIINNRPVAICAHGPSIKNLENVIEHYVHYDVCWASLNHFMMIEDNILSKINKHLSLVYCSAPIRIEQETENLKSFLNRDEDNLWITLPKIEYMTSKTLFDNENPSHGVFNTLFAFIVLLMKADVEDVILFGADGGTNDKENVYYDQDNFKINKQYEEDWEGKAHGLQNDTKVVNALWEKFCSDKGLPNNTKIINCSPYSFINCFPKVNHSEVLCMLDKEANHVSSVLT